MDNFDRFVVGGVLLFLLVMLYVVFEVNSRQQDQIDINQEWIQLHEEKINYEFNDR